MALWLDVPCSLGYTERYFKILVSSSLITLPIYQITELPFSFKGLRPLRADDMLPCTRLFEEYMSRFDLTPAFNVDDFIHWFTPRKGIVNSYVVDNQGEQI